MASRESALIDITPEVLLKAYSCGIFPDGGKRRRPGALLDRAGTARHHPARSISCAGPAGAHGAIRPLHRVGRSRLRCGHRRLRRSRGRGAREPGSMLASAISIASSTSAAIATPSKSMTARTWSAASTASVSAAPFSARACSTARATLRKSRSCIWWRGSRPVTTACSTPSSSPTILRTFGAVEVSRPVYHKLLDAALVGEGDFGALPVDRPVSGEAVLARLAG